MVFHVTVDFTGWADQHEEGQRLWCQRCSKLTLSYGLSQNVLPSPRLRGEGPGVRGFEIGSYTVSAYGRTCVIDRRFLSASTNQFISDSRPTSRCLSRASNDAELSG
jgi:hypothetical protein